MHSNSTLVLRPFLVAQYRFPRQVDWLSKPTATDTPAGCMIDAAPCRGAYFPRMEFQFGIQIFALDFGKHTSEITSEAYPEYHPETQKES